MRLAFGNLNAILATAGCAFDDVIDVTVFVVDPESNFEQICAWGPTNGATRRIPR